MKKLLAAVPLLLAGSLALAQGQPSPNVAPGDAGSRGPGTAGPAEVAHKWLLDANGATVGWIESADDSAASVRTKDGKHIQVSLRRLSLGNGPNTVIEASHSDADELNRIEQSVRPTLQPTPPQ
jgi:hypothetical protein